MGLRNLAEKKAETLATLAREIDAWVASASGTGEAYLVPLSYYWDGEGLVFSTAPGTRTARNLRRAGRARVSLPSTQDVVLVEGPVEFFALDVDPALADAYATHTTWDPRTEPEEFVFIRVRPWLIRAWRGVEELLAGKDVMREGVWLTDES
jgi:hypothetical protein